MSKYLIILIALCALVQLSLFFYLESPGEEKPFSSSKIDAAFILLLFTAVCFASTCVLLFYRFNIWHYTLLGALLGSQFLIINQWSSLKYLTIINAALFFSSLVFYSVMQFKASVKKETTSMLAEAISIDPTNFDKQKEYVLPPIVQKWLSASGVLDQPPIKSIYIQQELFMNLKPEQEKAYQATAEQYFTINPCAFNWSVKLKMAAIPIYGRDKFEHGTGEMNIKLLGILPVAQASNNAKTNQAALQRYLAEIVWFPQAAMSPQITWEQIDDYSAKATLKVNNTSGAGVFYFDEARRFKAFSALRYKETTDSQPTEWIVTATEHGKFMGIEVPTKSNVTWQLKNKKWTWLNLRIKSLVYQY